MIVAYDISLMRSGRRGRLIPDGGLDNHEITLFSHEEFMDAFQEEERALNVEGQSTIAISSVLKRGWEMGTFWYSLALESPTGLFALFYDHIQPRFAKGHLNDPGFFESIRVIGLSNLLSSWRQRSTRKRTMTCGYMKHLELHKFVISWQAPLTSHSLSPP